MSASWWDDVPEVVAVRNIAFEPVHALEDHAGGHTELLHVLRGGVEVCYERRRYKAGPGDTLITPAGTMHRDLFDIGQGLDVLLIHFTWRSEPAYLEAVGNSDLLRLGTDTRAEAGRIFDAMRSDFGSTELDRRLASSRLLCLLLLFFRDVGRRSVGSGADPEDCRETSRRARLVQEAKCYLEKHYHEGLTLERIAEALEISPFYLSRSFSQESDFSLFGYLTYVRMTQAATLLRESRLTVAEVAYRVGFDAPNYFSKVFRRFHGCSPSRFASQSL